MDEDSDWGSWGLDPAATRIQQVSNSHVVSLQSRVFKTAHMTC